MISNNTDTNIQVMRQICQVISLFQWRNKIENERGTLTSRLDGENKRQKNLYTSISGNILAIQDKVEYKVYGL